MAIGARILSNNLSGETANVTFFPTSGGTIDLGAQTIPFNNITTDPYGVYEIYVPTYDYTYELTINQAVNGVESFVFISKMISNNNNGVMNLNFNDFTAEVLDLGIDYTGWYINDIYPLTNSGYAYYFENENTCDLWWVVFTDSAGNVIGEYQANTDCDYDYDVLSGKLVYFTDHFNGITKYSNGQEVYTLTVDPAYQDFYFDGEWDGVTSSNTYVVKIDNTTGNTESIYVLSGETLIQMGDSFSSVTYDVQPATYFSGNFIPVRTYNNDNSEFESLKIYGVDASLLQTVNLSGLTYNDYQYSFYGDNKYYILFYNNGNSAVDYFIVHYDGNTDTLNTTTHDRGTNYESYDTFSDTRFFPNNGGCESFAITLYKYNTNNNIGTVVEYCDIIYMLSGDTNFRTYVFQDSGAADKTINLNFSRSNSLNTLCDNGDGIVSTLSLVQSGATYNSLNIPMSGNPSNWNQYTIRNGSVFITMEDSTNTIVTLSHVVEGGILADMINGIPLNGSYSLEVEGIADIFQFTNYSADTYHVDSTSDLFQSGGTLSGDTLLYFYPGNQFKQDFLTTGPILTFNTTTRESNILSSTGYTDTFILPEFTSVAIEVGSNKFMYTFIDMSGFTNINLYDFNYNLLNSIVTEYTSRWYSLSCGDRFVSIIDENNQYISYLVSESTITSTSLTNDNSYSTVNDFIYWD